MRLECKYDELLPLENVKKRWHPDNENNHPDAQIRSLAKAIGMIGIRHCIHISKQSGKICGGHGRLLAFQKLGYTEVPVIWENFKDEVEEVNYRSTDNIGQYAEFNYDEYKINLQKHDIDLSEIDLEAFGIIDVEIEDIETDLDNDDEKYTRKVESPIYEPQEESAPDISQLYDESKTSDLIEEINKSKVPKEVKSFLTHAAFRHTKINYKYVAEYYAHADEETQRLIENSALVVIDFDKAIENGFVEMTEAFREQYEKQD